MFFPFLLQTLYDIVVSAYTLFELPSKQARLETILTLWQKTRKYLVIVERGTNPGFQVTKNGNKFLIFAFVDQVTK